MNSTENGTTPTPASPTSETPASKTATLINAAMALLTAASDGTLRNLVRVLLPTLLGSGMIYGSAPLAQLVNEPALAPWGLFLGGSFFAVAVSHILRRILFPQIDLQAFADLAKGSAIGAGLVFLGICIVLAAFVILNGSMLRT